MSTRTILNEGDFRRVRAAYLAEVHEFSRLIERAKRDLKHVKFDTMVGTGLSGALVIPRLADAFGVKWLITRKPNDDSHTNVKGEGDIGRRWLFVDDLVSSGRTYARVRETVDAICVASAYNPFDSSPRGPWKTEHIGVWCYDPSHGSGFESWEANNYRRRGSELYYDGIDVDVEQRGLRASILTGELI